MRTKRDKTNSKLLNYYRAYRNKLTTLIRKAKEQFYINKIKKCEGNGREIWKVINEHLGKKFCLCFQLTLKIKFFAYPKGITKRKF